MLVCDVMSTAPIVVTPSTSLNDLLALFDRHDYNAFPVLAPGGRVVGILTKLDVLRLFLHQPATQRSQEDRMSAADIMQRKVVSIQPGDTLVDAGNLMVVTRLRSVPVAEGRRGGRKLVGMLSRGDVLRGLRFEAERGTFARDEARVTGAEGSVRSRDIGGGRIPDSVETLIDQMGEQSFPASDPPAWGVVRARLEALGWPKEGSEEWATDLSNSKST